MRCLGEARGVRRGAALVEGSDQRLQTLGRHDDALGKAGVRAGGFQARDGCREPGMRIGGGLGQQRLGLVGEGVDAAGLAVHDARQQAQRLGGRGVEAGAFSEARIGFLHGVLHLAAGGGSFGQGAADFRTFAPEALHFLGQRMQHQRERLGGRGEGWRWRAALPAEAGEQARKGAARWRGGLGRRGRGGGGGVARIAFQCRTSLRAVLAP